MAPRIGQRGSARQHARGCPSRESQKQHRLRLRARFYQTRHAINQRPSLSGARAGDNQQRPFGGHHRLELRFVQFLFVVDLSSARRARNGLQNELGLNWNRSRLGPAQFEIALDGLKLRSKFGHGLIAILRSLRQRSGQNPGDGG